MEKQAPDVLFGWKGYSLLTSSTQDARIRTGNVFDGAINPRKECISWNTDQKSLQTRSRIGLPYGVLMRDEVVSHGLLQDSSKPGPKAGHERR